MSASALEKNTASRPRFRFTRKRILAIFLIVMGALALFQANQALDYSVTTILTLQAGNPAEVPSITVPTLMFVNVTAAVFILSGIIVLLNRPELERFGTGMMVISGILIIPVVFIAAAAGSSTNVTTMLSESFRLATPVAIGAMAGLWCERSGVVNIAIEGMMLTGACFAFLTLYYILPNTPDEMIGLAMFFAVCVGILAGGVAALLHAWLSITFMTDQIVSGTVINILAVGVTSFVRREFLSSTEGGIQKLPTVPIPVLSDIPVLGDVFFNNQPIFYMMFVMVIGSHFVLYYTRWGLRTQSVGEKPEAADSLGINVNRMRWINVFIGGLIAGLAGAWFSLEATGRFTNGMTRGSGFIALAALIFGKWTPFGAFGGALLFGFSDALGTRFQIISVPIPVQFLQMVPYLVTIVVLAGLVGRAFPPKAVGTPYKKE